MLKPASYTFTLNNILFKPMSVNEIDARKDDLEYQKIIIPAKGYVIKPGDFVLGQTRETLSISDKLVCFLEARTSLARIGLTVLQGSIFVEPGQEDSHETLEIKNISSNPIRLYPSMKIVKGIFALLYSAASQKYAKIGKYARQSNSKAIINEKL